MKIEDIKPQMRVSYIPGHAGGDAKHPDVEHGTVSSVNSKYAFVRFDKQVSKFGWEGATSQSCDPNDLIPQGEFSLTAEHIDIMDHTLNRAAGGFYCGDSRAMQELVKEGLMVSAGRKSFVPDEYFSLTRKGREALTLAKAGGAQ